VSKIYSIRLTDPLIRWRLIPRAINPLDPPHLSAIGRWAFVGVGKPRVRLATVKIGGRRYTTAAAIEAFIAATSGGAVPTPETNDRREADILHAEHELDAGGVG
jgi:hypothetical protein